jgi:dienelactone hydrolase
LVEAGFFVAVLKDPLGFSILDPDHPDSVIRLHPDIAYWALGGHSLGGTTAVSAADRIERVDGLVLFASYPASRMQRTDLKVVSVFGSDDGLVAPADIEKAKADLPPATAFLEVPGAAHSWFGDYGVQPGDNPGLGDRAAAQATMVEAVRTLLAALAPPAKK